MQIPAEIVAALIAVWIGLQLTMLRQIGRLETQQALNKQRIAATERLLDDILQRYFHNRTAHSTTKRNIDPDFEPGLDGVDDGNPGS